MSSMMIWLACCTVLFQYIGAFPVFCLNLSKSHSLSFRNALGRDKSGASASSGGFSRFALRRWASESTCERRAAAVLLNSSNRPSGVREKRSRRIASQVTTLICSTAETRSSAKASTCNWSWPVPASRPYASRPQPHPARQLNQVH